MVGTACACAIEFSNPLLPLARVVASRLDRWRNFRRVITTYLSAKDTTTARRVSAAAPCLPCRRCLAVIRIAISGQTIRRDGLRVRTNQ
jgi:hypothetical protein